jgi:ABC-type transport system involved in multi-copper enzyme maturation permease subunit
MDTIDWHAVKVLARKEVEQLMQLKKPTIFIIVVSILIFLVFPVLTPILTFLGYPPAGRSLLEGMRYLARLLMPMFLLYPPMITNVIVTDSFAGEKERKTIESLLLLPCSTTLLVLAKVIVALVPAFLFIIGSFLSIGIISNISIAGYSSMIIFNEVEWYMMIFLAAPLFIIMFNFCGILASIVAHNVKSAQFLAGISSIPLLLMIMVIAVNSITLTPGILLLLSGACLLVDICQFCACIRTFDREKFVLQSD